MWVPGNVSIVGNENTDKTVMELGNGDEEIMLITSRSELLEEVKKKLNEEMQRIWSTRTHHKLRAIKEDIKEWSTRRNRRVQTVLTRIRIGHTKLTH